MSEQKPRKSKKQYRLLFENNPQPMWVFDRKTLQFLAVNDAAVEHYGYSRKEFLRMFIFDIRPPDDIPLLLNYIKLLDSKKTKQQVNDAGIWRHRKKDGMLIDVEVRVSPICFKGRDAMLVLVSDVTHRKKGEEAIRKSEERFRLLAENAQDLIYRYRLAPIPGFEYVSPAATLITGYTPEEYYADPNLAFKLVHPLDRPLLEAITQISSSIGNPLILREPLVLRWTRKDGTIIWTEQRNVPVHDEWGNLVAIEGVARDVTLRTEMEEALRESEKRFRALIENSSDAVVLTNAEGTILYAGPSIRRILGYSAEELVGRNGFEFIHFDDLEYTKRLFSELLQKPGETMTGQYRFLHKDGTWQWLETIGTNLLDEPSVQAIISNHRDVSERKQSEEALRIKTEQLATVTQAMTGYLKNGDWQEASAQILRSALSQTGSEYGFVGAVVEGPALRILAHEGITWDTVANREFYENALRTYQKVGYLEFTDFENLFGRVITSGKVVLTSDAASDPRSGGVPPGHPPLRNFLGVPILRETEVVGIIGVANRPGGYTGAEQAGIEILSQAAGVLYDNYQRQIREAALENKRREAEKELKNSREQLRNLSTRLQSMLEEERTRISREIHDELGQMLTALKMELSWLKNRLTEDQTSLQEKASSMLRLVDTTLSTMRKISTELRPGILDDLGLIAAIEWQAHEFQNRTGIQCKIHVSPENIALDPVRTTTIFRIFQEALTNAARHSNADKINVRLKKKGNNLILEVKDNGRGITENEILHSKSLGLLGIRERVHLWGGKVKIHGIQGKGTTLAVRIPLPASPDVSKAEEKLHD